jgi:hypothetical protein
MAFSHAFAADGFARGTASFERSIRPVVMADLLKPTR